VALRRGPETFFFCLFARTLCYRFGDRSEVLERKSRMVKVALPLAFNVHFEYVELCITTRVEMDKRLG